MYEDIKRDELAVKDSLSQEYITECWPKDSVYFDYLNPKTIDYHVKIYTQVPDEVDDKDSYIWNNRNVLIWNDMNEPACFNNNEGTMPKSNLHLLPDG